MYAVLATAALLATSALAGSSGQAVVQNACSYDVYLSNVPAEGGGFEAITQTLSPNGTYSQEWTELSNSQGWSIKLSKDTGMSNIMQYEYTYHEDGIIWYDLSDVNGNPWDGDWEITADSPSSDCSPKDQAYRYATDDAYGMQACAADSVITVTLCSGEDGGDAPSASSSVASPTSTATSAPSSYSYSSSSSSATPSSYSSSFAWNDAAVATGAADSSPSPTTFATATSSTTSAAVTTAPDGAAFTDYDVAVVTEVVTQTAAPGRFRRDLAHLHRRHGHA